MVSTDEFSDLLTAAAKWLPPFFMRRARLAEADAQDAAQMALMRAWERREQCHAASPAQAAAWLKQVAWRAWLMERRAQPRQPIASLDGLLEAPGGGGSVQANMACNRAMAAQRALEARLAVASLARAAGDAGLLARAFSSDKHRAFRARRRLASVAKEGRHES